MIRVIKRKLLTLISDKMMLLLLLIAFIEVVMYRSVLYAGFENNIDPYVLPATSTLFLQKLLGTEGTIATLSSYFYMYAHLFALCLLGFVVFFSENQKMNMFAIVLSFALDSLIYLIFPLAPPVRTEAAVPIRVLVFPESDALISIKYSAFPSGHIAKSILGYLISKKENLSITMYFYAVNAVLTSLVIVYLGEHYTVDILGGILLAFSCFKLAYYIDKKYMNKEKKAAIQN